MSTHQCFWEHFCSCILHQPEVSRGPSKAAACRTYYTVTIACLTVDNSDLLIKWVHIFGRSCSLGIQIGSLIKKKTPPPFAKFFCTLTVLLYIHPLLTWDFSAKLGNRSTSLYKMKKEHFLVKPKQIKNQQKTAGGFDPIVLKSPGTLQ